MLGGSPICPTCSKAVYFAEQVIGPARKIYHKPCLVCKQCKKRLESGSWVQHDDEPYCARCHNLQFGTRDLRFGNHLSSSVPGPSTSSPPRSEPSTPVRTAAATQRVESPTTRPNFQAARPIAGGPAPAALDDRGLLTLSPRSKVGAVPFAETPLCGGCGKRVYAAEQIMAVGRKWHRGCLKCVGCGSSLDPAKVADRAGTPYCRVCYEKNHGPVGKR